MGLDDLLAPLAGLLADREQADRRVLDLEHGGAEGGAEEGELDQVLGADLDVGADVEEEHRFAGDRHLHRQGRALHALEPAQPEGRRRHRRPGRAAADHRVGGVVGDVAGGEHDRGLGLRADRRHRILLVGDPLRGRHHLDPVDPVEAELALGTEDADADPVGGGEPRPLGEHVETLLSPVPVEGNGHAAPRRHGYSESEARRRGLGDFVSDDLTPGVSAAGRADPMRQPRAVAARAAVQARPCRPCGWRAACRAGRWKFSSSGRPSVAGW